jgi:uncharacterized tellurite resistance protein B-like protein
MTQTDPRDKKHVPKQMSERQMEVAIAVGGGALLVVTVAMIFMINAWGLSGTLWRLAVIAILAGAGLLAWRYRRAIKARVARMRLQAAQRAAAAAAQRARLPQPLRGMFPRDMTFLGVGATLSTDRGTVRDPLVYVASGMDLHGREPSLISADLPVARSDLARPEPLPYWPRYSQASPDQRSVYLDWILGGRQSLPREIGYAFMFFYGLERRAMVDQADHNAIIAEVIRLRKLNAALVQPNRSFDSYSTGFLWFLAAAMPGKLDAQAIEAMAQSTRSWNEESLSSALGWFAERGKGMPAWLAVEVAGQLRGSMRSVVVDRVGEQFRELFAKRYAESWPNGMLVKSSKRRRLYQYKAASAVLGTVKLSDGPNPLGLMSQFNALSDIWNGCVDALRRLSTVVQREGMENLTAAAWKALPEEIRSDVDHPMTDAVCRLVHKSTDDEGRTLITVRKAAEALAFDAKSRYSLADSKWIGETFEQCGYCLEPDARLTSQSYDGDETVTAFLRTTDQNTTTGRYAAAACMLRFGMAVIVADGQVQPEELTVLLQDLEQMFELNDHERRRLDALRTLISATGADLDGLSKMAKGLKVEHREAIGKLLLVLAAKDGVVTKEEIAAIRKCYRKLGFAQQEIGHALSSLRAHQGGDDTVTIRPAIAGAAGEAIPAAELKPVLTLNRAAIAQIMADTREVAKLLADAMNAGEKPGETPFSTPFIEPQAEPVPSMTASVLAATKPEISDSPTKDKAVGVAAVGAGDDSDDPEPAIPQRLAGFYQMLISKQQWDLKDVDGLARQQGLMLSGALDALNEWAAEKYGGQLFVEDGAKLYVEQTYLS